VITDDTNNINGTIYDEVVEALIGEPCRNIIERGNMEELNMNQQIMQAIVNKEAKFRILPIKNDRTGSVRCTSDRAVPIQKIIQTETPSITNNAPPTPQKVTGTERQTLSIVQGESSSANSKTTVQTQKTAGKVNQATPSDDLQLNKPKKQKQPKTATAYPKTANPEANEAEIQNQGTAAD